jgi:hypothetical protein
VPSRQRAKRKGNRAFRKGSRRYVANLIERHVMLLALMHLASEWVVQAHRCAHGVAFRNAEQRLDRERHSIVV